MKIYVRWYPQNLPDRDQWHKNFANQASQTGTDNGLTVAEVAQIATDATIASFFNAQTGFLDAEFEAFRAARDAFLDGSRDATEPEMPTFTIPALPLGALVAVAERTERYADKIKAADNYSPSVGGAYGIVAAGDAKVPNDQKKPSAKVLTLPEFKVNFVISMQGMKAVQMQMERDGDPTVHKSMWTEGDITDDTPPQITGKAETRRYRFYFLEKNQITGISSEIYEVTIHP